MKLVAGESCFGASAQSAYLHLCNDFGFDINLSCKFAKQQKLYAENATKERYGVWFIAHSNYTDFVASNWSNDFIDSDDIIKEHWKDTNIPGFTIKENLNTRVVFAKKGGVVGNYNYYFMGVYEYYQTIGHDRYFRRISTIYPIKKNNGSEMIKNDFIRYLRGRGYSEFTPKGLPSTVYDYPKRIEFIIEQEQFNSWQDMIDNIDKLLIEYDIGGNKEMLGHKSHDAVINALKRFDEFLKK